MDSHFIPGWTLVYEQSFHARVVWSMDSHFMPGWSGLWAGLIPCQDGLWPMSRVRFMPGWSLLYEQGFFSCQGGLWSMDRVRFMPGLSGLRTGFDVRYIIPQLCGIYFYFFEPDQVTQRAEKNACFKGTMQKTRSFFRAPSVFQASAVHLL